MIEADTPVRITMKALVISLGAIGSFILAGGGILAAGFAYTVGHMREDIGKIERGERENLNRTRDVEIDLAKQIGGLRVDLANFSSNVTILSNNVTAMSTRLDNSTKSIDGLSFRLDKFQGELNAMQAGWNDPKRLAEFVQELKKQGLDDQRIVIVPLR